MSSVLASFVVWAMTVEAIAMCMRVLFMIVLFGLRILLVQTTR